MNYNKVIVAGNLTGDPEKKVTDSGTTVVNFTIASNRHYTTDDGKKQETEYHNIVFFGKTAEHIHKYLEKGSSALVEGRLKTSSWEDDDGKKRTSTEIVGRNVQFGSGSDNKQSNDEYQGSTSQEKETPTVEDNDIDVDDIPFK